jgi:hypothetical protein
VPYASQAPVLNSRAEHAGEKGWDNDELDNADDWKRGRTDMFPETEVGEHLGGVFRLNDFVQRPEEDHDEHAETEQQQGNLRRFGLLHDRPPSWLFSGMKIEAIPLLVQGGPIFFKLRLRKIDSYLVKS